VIIYRLPLFVLRGLFFPLMLLSGGCWVGAAHTASAQATAIDDDQDAMDRLLAPGLVITFPNGAVQTKEDMIAGLNSDDELSEEPVPHMEDRAIRVIGTTAIPSSVYVSSIRGPTQRMTMSDGARRAPFIQFPTPPILCSSTT
jgi:hypothetical protein